MPKEITNYQCPNCTAPLHFSEASGLLECDYCGSSFTVEAVEEMYSAQNESASAATQAAETQEQTTQWDEERDNIRPYSCPSCGAELILPAETAASCCPYCGNPTIVPGKLSGARRPDYVIPFKMNKAAAVAALKKHYQGKPLLPRAFSSENHIEQIQGVYVPFWLMDATASGEMDFQATRVFHHSTAKENITETDHFLVRRGGSQSFRRVPADASQRMPDAHMDAIEPFDYAELKPFSLSYLPGFIADRYDVEKEDVKPRVTGRCRNSFADSLRNSAAGYATCVSTREDISVETGDVKYAMLPVWMLATQWNGQHFLFAMNGQTGKLIGDLPVDKSRLAGFCGAAFAAVAVIAQLIYLLG